MPVMSGLKGMRQEESCEVEANLDYIVFWQLALQGETMS